MVLGKLDSHMQKNEPGPLFYTIHKDQFNIRSEIIKRQEENIGSNLFDISLGDDYLNLTPKTK